MPIESEEAWKARMANYLYAGYKEGSVIDRIDWFAPVLYTVTEDPRSYKELMNYYSIKNPMTIQEVTQYLGFKSVQEYLHCLCDDYLKDKKSRE